MQPPTTIPCSRNELMARRSHFRAVCQTNEQYVMPNSESFRHPGSRRTVAKYLNEVLVRLPLCPENLRKLLLEVLPPSDPANSRN